MSSPGVLGSVSVVVGCRNVVVVEGRGRRWAIVDVAG